MTSTSKGMPDCREQVNRARFSSAPHPQRSAVCTFSIVRLLTACLLLGIQGSNKVNNPPTLWGPVFRNRRAAKLPSGASSKVPSGADHPRGRGRGEGGRGLLQRRGLLGGQGCQGRGAPNDSKRPKGGLQEDGVNLRLGMGQRGCFEFFFAVLT